MTGQLMSFSLYILIFLRQGTKKSSSELAKRVPLNLLVHAHELGHLKFGMSFHIHEFSPFYSSFTAQKQQHFSFQLDQNSTYTFHLSQVEDIVKMEGSAFTPAIEGMKLVKSEKGELLTMPFLDVCKLILPILDKFGTAMTIVKSDISGNISKLESKYSSNPSRFNYVYSIVQAEVEIKTAKSSSSCTNALLWLTRAMDFIVELFHNLAQHQDWSAAQACNDSYSKTLKKWHGWLSSSSFMVALKLVPDRKKFLEVIGNSDNVYDEMETFCSTFTPILGEIHRFLHGVGLDSMKAS